MINEEQLEADANRIMQKNGMAMLLLIWRNGEDMALRCACTNAADQAAAKVLCRVISEAVQAAQEEMNEAFRLALPNPPPREDKP